MEIYPAVDLYEGKVVRLERGDYAKQTVYSQNPRQIAKRWVEAGASWLHVVDLEGARSGEIKNWEGLEEILSIKEASVQFGGGVRKREDVDQLIEKGVKRVILGSKALEPLFLKKVTDVHPGRIALSLDLRGDEVQVEGWTKGGGKSVFALFEEIKGFSIDCLIVTDIDRDGTLSGINLQKIGPLLEKATFPIILSGGVTSLEDVRALIALRADRLKGVIIGKALYEGRVDLSKVFDLIQRGEE